jgi:hypothetical protein
MLTAAVALSGVTLRAATCSLSCTLWGVDDNNTTTLTPSSPTYITTSTWLNNAIATSSFNNANWTFTFAGDPTLVTSSDFVNQIYSAWVVTNDPITGYDGNQYSRPVTGQDAGGANFELGYYNLTDGSPLTTSVSFLQIYSQSINGGPTTYALDNGGVNTSPFYVESGGVGGTTTIDARPANWMLDIPYDCESGLTGPANCTGGTDDTRLSASVNFQVFVAVNTVTDGVNNVTLYAGESWGYLYTNTDAPEPALGFLSAALLAALVTAKKYRTR